MLRVLAHTFWGADQETLLHLYDPNLVMAALFMDLLVAHLRGVYSDTTQLN